MEDALPLGWGICIFLFYFFFQILRTEKKTPQENGYHKSGDGTDTGRQEALAMNCGPFQTKPLQIISQYTFIYSDRRCVTLVNAFQAQTDTTETAQIYRPQGLVSERPVILHIKLVSSLTFGTITRGKL